MFSVKPGRRENIRTTGYTQRRAVLAETLRPRSCGDIQTAGDQRTTYAWRLLEAVQCIENFQYLPLIRFTYQADSLRWKGHKSMNIHLSFANNYGVGIILSACYKYK
jgi:hypothetical protein